MARCCISLLVWLATLVTTTSATGQIPRNEPTARTDLYGDPLPPGALVRFGTVRFRHGNGASMAFGADSKTILTANARGEIWTWDVRSGQLLREQRYPANSWTSFAVLSPDARYLAYQDENTVCIWDRNRNLQTCKLGEIDLHRPQLFFSPDSKTLITAEENGRLCAWTVATGQARILGSHKSILLVLSMPTNDTLLSMGAEGIIRLWDLASGKQRTELKLGPILHGAALSPSGRIIAVHSRQHPEFEKELQFLDAATGKPAQGWIAPNVHKVHTVRFAPDEKTVLVATQKEVVVWDPLAGKPVHTLQGGSGFSLTLSPDGKTVATLGGGPSLYFRPFATMVRVWDLTTGNLHPATASERGHPGEVHSLAIAPNKKLLASASGNEDVVRLWDPATGRLLRTLPVDKGPSQYCSVVFSPDSQALFVVGITAIVRWDVASGRAASRYSVFDPSKDEDRGLRQMHLSDGGRTLLALYQKSNGPQAEYGVLAWNVATAQPLRTIERPAGAYQDPFLSPDGRILDRSAGNIIDITTGTLLPKIPHQTGMPAFSPEGAMLATGVANPSDPSPAGHQPVVATEVWDMLSQKLVCRLETGEVGQIAFLPDGRRLLTLSFDGIKLWDLLSGKSIASLPAPGRFYGASGSSFAGSFDLSADGAMLVTGHPDTTVLLWDFPPPLAKPKVAALSKEELESCWADLAGNDGGRALRASAQLVDRPGQTLLLLQARLSAIKGLADSELRQLIGDLDNNRFSTRQAATKRLAELGELAEPALRAALAGKPSLETRQRLEALLVAERPPLTAERLRHLRAVRVLEQIGSSEAQAVLTKLSQGAPGARLTQESQAALERLARKRSTTN